MKNITSLPLFTLLLMISFASVNAVLFTPALPNIAHFFMIDDGKAQQTLTWFLVGYALGQLLYGPLANRWGRKKALFAGVGLQIISSLVCAFSGVVHAYWLLLGGRLLLALGSGVGLKMTFTLVNECYPQKIATQKISYLMLAFAIAPGLAIAIGGLVNTYFGWMSCFYLGALYGVVFLILTIRLPETLINPDTQALQIEHLLSNYGQQFRNIELVKGGFLMGMASSFIYLFAALAPFIAMNLLGLTSAQYGIDCILPNLGLLTGSLFSAQFSKKYSSRTAILVGISILILATIFMLFAMLLGQSALVSLFLPVTLGYFGLALILPNASALAMNNTADKAHGSAVMNFINMGLVAVIILFLGFVKTTELLLPITYLILCLIMFWQAKPQFKES